MSALPTAQPDSQPVIDQLRSRCEALNRHHELVQDAYQDLPAAVREDLQDRYDRLGTMMGALNRDIEEMLVDRGADAERVAGLEKVIETELATFDHEIETLSQGYPSTLTAGLDKLLETLDRVAGAFRRD